MSWETRSAEERNLLNPSFCSVLIWHAAQGYCAKKKSEGLPFELAFLILPMVLHRETRENLPKTIKTSVPVWLNSHPISRAHVADRAQVLVPFTKEAIIFGGVHGILSMADGWIAALPISETTISSVLKQCSNEVRECAKRAEFVGRWLSALSNSVTAMALFGVKP